MITRLSGMLETVEGGAAVLAPAGGGGAAYEVLLPAFVAQELAPRAGQSVSLVILQYLEGQGQGSSFIPRLIGFMRREERAFFELLTTVSGIGNRKALRMMAWKPGTIARAIAEKDARGLATLPEVGKRLAEKIIAELDGKVDGFLGGDGEVGRIAEVKARGGQRALADPVAEEAVLALVALGQTRGEAEDSITRAMGRRNGAAKRAEELLDAVFGRAG